MAPYLLSREMAELSDAKLLYPISKRIELIGVRLSWQNPPLRVLSQCLVTLLGQFPTIETDSNFYLFPSPRGFGNRGHLCRGA